MEITGQNIALVLLHCIAFYYPFTSVEKNWEEKAMRTLTVSIAFPVLSSFNEGPFISVSRKKCFPFTASAIAMSLSSCTFYWHYFKTTLHKVNRLGT